MKSILRDLFYLARETISAVAEGVSLGLKVVRDESPGRDEITHGPAWMDDGGIVGAIRAYTYEPSPADGAVTDPVACERPAAAASATDAAAGHPNVDREVIRKIVTGHIGNTFGSGDEIADDIYYALIEEVPEKLATAAAYGLGEWIEGETCTAPTYFKSIIDDLEQLSR